MERRPLSCEYALRKSQIDNNKQTDVHFFSLPLDEYSIFQMISTWSCLFLPFVTIWAAEINPEKILIKYTSLFSQQDLLKTSFKIDWWNWRRSHSLFRRSLLPPSSCHSQPPLAFIFLRCAHTVNTNTHTLIHISHMPVTIIFHTAVLWHNTQYVDLFLLLFPKDINILTGRRELTVFLATHEPERHREARRGLANV